MSELLKRATPGLALAGVALTCVWLFDPALRGPTDSAAPAPGPGEAAPDAAEEPGATGVPGDDAQAAPAPTGPDCATTTTATGEPAMTRWGPVQVTVDLSGDGTVCAVRAIAYPDGDPRSAQINARAIPILDAAAADVGVQFDAVSGATYTSEAYRSSLQSVLDGR